MAIVSKPVLLVAFLFGGLGLIVSRPTLLLWLNSESAIAAFFIWYIVFFVYVEFASLLLFHRLDLSTIRGGFGIVLLLFAFGTVDYWALSNYSLIAVGSNPSNVPSFALATEDQILYVFWHTILPWIPNYPLGILIYVVTPVLLVILAAFIIGPRRLLRSAANLFRVGA